MIVVEHALGESYWENFQVDDQDIEFLYNHLLDKETPLTSQELITALVAERIQKEKQAIEKQRSSGGATFLPKETYAVQQNLVFPALNWRAGKVVETRPGHNPDLGEFTVMKVAFENGDLREFATGLAGHALNDPLPASQEDETIDLKAVLTEHGEILQGALEDALAERPDFVRIAGKWFPRALLVEINAGHLNLAEAVLDMSGGGPLPTLDLMAQVGLASVDNAKLIEFSMDMAMQEDPRFDEVGPSGTVLWFLNRLEPEGVLKLPQWLRSADAEYDRSVLSADMLAWERSLDDELSPFGGKHPKVDEVQFSLIFPHWRAGTLPLSPRLRHLFPTAYESPRIQFTLVDGETGEKFSGWVVRTQRYVYGLQDWYRAKGAMPGTLVRVRRGERPGEVIIKCDTRRPTKEWVRTVLVGSDGGVVFGMFKQPVSTLIDERMAIAVPNLEAIDQLWSNAQKDRVPFEKVLAGMVRELAKLNPQSHVHASELYAALNIVRRCSPGAIMALLASRPWFVHVGDLHFRFDDSERA